MAAGCASEEACAALYAEAHARYARCANSDNRDCANALADQISASDMLERQRQEKTFAVRAENEREGDAQARFEEDAARYGSTCKDIVALEHAGEEAATDRARQAYRDLVKKRRDAASELLAQQIDRYLDASFRVTGPKATADIRAAEKELACVDPAAAAQRHEAVEAWATERETSAAKAAAADAACAASPRCQANQFIPELCATVKDRRECLASIAAEKRNPAGVVDLVTLHSLGAQVQDDDDRIAELKKQYAALTHAPFDVRVCSGQ